MAFKIYYLDDEIDLCENFVDYFASGKVHVTAFTDPSRAIEAVKKTPPDLFFIDYRLPGISGDEIAKLLDPGIPKFLITGDTSVKVEYKFEKIFPKPFSVSEISRLIATYTGPIY